ncbi:MAG: MFS transporter [Gemmatimonadota bacterium]|jgi:nucleoside transporter
MSNEQAEQSGGLGAELASSLRLAFSQPRLSVMMFLQYAIWGAWAVDLARVLETELGFSGFALGLIYSALPLANLLAPFTAGQVADRWMPAQIALAVFQLIGGGLLIVMGYQSALGPMLILLLIYSLLFAPTLALTNSIALQNLKDPQRDFGPIRVWGTLGWIAANLALTGWRKLLGPDTAFIDVFVLAGVISILLGLFSFALPRTPPAKEARDPLAFREATVLFRNRSYLVFFIIAFIVATELQMYYVLTAPFLGVVGAAVGIEGANVPAWMTIAQVAEIFVMTFMLPYVLPRWGVRKTLMVGIIAWPVRYFVFALTWPLYQSMPWMVWLSIASLALHGFCYVFFFVVAFIYTDMVAPPDIRSSAQALINVAVLGLGSLIGANFAGVLKDMFTTGAETNYFVVFMVPAVITLLCAVAFPVFFRPKDEEIAGS